MKTVKLVESVGERRVSSVEGMPDERERHDTAAVLPLPQGEGRGEGEGIVRRPVASNTHTLRATLATRPSTLTTRLAFTLIELLVVIAIMAVLAALIIPITGAVNRHKLRSRTRAELRSIETAIEDYKTKRGYYPPDNPNSPLPLNQLYYELSGTVYSNGFYTTLDGNATVNAATQLPGAFGKSQVNGFMNTTKGGGDEGMAAQKYLRELKPAQVATMISGIKILVGSVGWEPNWPWQPLPTTPPNGAQKPGVNPFHYISTNPTNNPNKFDLWIDILVQGKTNRVCNWSDDVLVL
jgi:prepilin-type N-terminal cleavage/methylation domain-containing protein